MSQRSYDITVSLVWDDLTDEQWASIKDALQKQYLPGTKAKNQLMWLMQGIKTIDNRFDSAKHDVELTISSSD